MSFDIDTVTTAISTEFLLYPIDSGIAPKAVPLKRGRPIKIPTWVLRPGESFAFPKTASSKVWASVTKLRSRFPAREYVIQRENSGYRCFRLK